MDLYQLLYRSHPVYLLGFVILFGAVGFITALWLNSLARRRRWMGKILSATPMYMKRLVEKIAFPQHRVQVMLEIKRLHRRGYIHLETNPNDPHSPWVVRREKGGRWLDKHRRRSKIKIESNKSEKAITR